ncbi:MAG TPA: ATP-grasp domain-containing protein [Candidatus Limnocylindrales bacterium]|nr:ATP-grasp domain-containing protein [Candidatus Limnocylindrales bacterium]
MMPDLQDFRLVTASAYPGMMAPLTTHPSCLCVLSGDADQAVSGRTAEGPAALSLEALDGVRRRWRFGDVARLADFVPKVLADDPRPDRRPILLIPPRASAAWEAAAQAWPGKVRLAASPRRVVEPIAEDKIQVREWLRRIDIRVPMAIATGDVDFAATAASLGAPFVMQAPGGAGGQGTYLVETKQDVERAQGQMPHVERWLLSRFSGELTINASGIVHADGVSPLPVSIQTSGIQRLGVGFGAYCGSDFAAAAGLPAAVLHQAGQISLRIGQWLREQGHRGVFGADIAVDGQELSVLEVNPRIQGSSWLVGCLEQHLLAILGADTPSTPSTPSPAPRSGDLPGNSPVDRADHGTLPGKLRDLGQPRTAGSHLLVRWRGPAGVIHALPEATVGITALPAVGTTVLPGAIIARIQSAESLAGPTGHDLRPQTHALLDRLFGAIEITTASV